METLKVRTYIGDDGILKIQLPQQLINQELDVVIVFHPAQVAPVETLIKPRQTPEELGFSRRFLEEVIGSWEGEPLERPEQLPFTEREEIQWHTS
jgi:hypothetical protein